MKLRNAYCLSAVLMIGLGLGSCTKEGPYTHYEPVSRYDGTVYQYLESRPDHFRYLMFVLEKAGLADMLKQDSITFFAPTDQSLSAAMDEYNIYRQSQGLPAVAMDGIDSSSWRAILAPYLIRGAFKAADFEGQDGLMVRSVALRNMHGQLIRHNASGVAGLGSETIEFSYLNGSRFTRDWLSAYVATPDIQADNGMIQILESRHVLGFNYFIDKAREPQNLYSEPRAFASGTITFPNTDVRIWTLRVKKLTARGSDTVQTEAADLLSNGFVMNLIIHQNDSVTVESSPLSVNLSIGNNGPCYFDPETLTFTLNYHYMGDDGYRNISETIKYVAE